jgi:hypothetical protein
VHDALEETTVLKMKATLIVAGLRDNLSGLVYGYQISSQLQIVSNSGVSISCNIRLASLH